MAANGVVQEFIGDIKTILGEQGPNEAGLQRIAERMRGLAKHFAETDTGEAQVSNVHTGGPRSEPIYQEDDGLLLVRARFGPEAMTPIHSHGSWGVIGIYRGRDRYQVWRRLDDGHGAGEARVELVEERVMGPGDTIILPPPPQDIHAQQGYGGEPVYELVLFGKNTRIIPRLYFDPTTNSAREVISGQG